MVGCSIDAWTTRQPAHVRCPRNGRVLTVNGVAATLKLNSQTACNWIDQVVVHRNRQVDDMAMLVGRHTAPLRRSISLQLCSVVSIERSRVMREVQGVT